jgi:hypothetical protein
MQRSYPDWNYRVHVDYHCGSIRWRAYGQNGGDDDKTRIAGSLLDEWFTSVDAAFEAAKASCDDSQKFAGVWRREKATA